MPFATPEYDHAFGEFLYKVVNDLARTRSPLLSMISQETTRSTVASRVRDREGLDVDMPEQTAGFKMKLDIEEIRAGDPVALVVELDRASAELARELVGMVVITLDKITEATGNVVSSENGLLDFDSFYAALDGIDWSLDEDGELVLPSFVMHPDTAAKAAELPPLTAEQQAKMDALEVRKREEILARRRHRRLS